MLYNVIDFVKGQTMDLNDKLNIVDGENLKFRNEIKYVVTEAELALISGRISPIMKKDSHVGPNGIYRIRSTYFDDLNDSCFYENENGTDKREKFRVRIYDASDKRITLECKFKERSMTRKESTPITREMYEKMVDGTFSIPDDRKDDKLLRKFYQRYKKDGLRPRIIVAYERTPFVYHVGNVRVTFDKNIGYSDKVENLFDEYLPLRPVMPVGRHVLEVKYDELLPTFIYGPMNLRDLRQETYSKYYLSRTFSLKHMYK
ncbi:MAG: polyphosphate polymerase domain-containing protein [Lachnospiraceae bacterium]|nr:polyphosphate polymerase domain-containing protein [Lachnospiraceae bacterium]